MILVLSLGGTLYIFQKFLRLLSGEIDCIQNIILVRIGFDGERRVTIEIGSNILTISSWPRVTDVLGMSLHIFSEIQNQPAALGNARKIRGVEKEGQGRA